jgi:hypothetical protein
MSRRHRLAGVHEAAQILGISKSALADRRRHGDPRRSLQEQPSFPAPLAVLRCGPIWDADELYRYRRRYESYSFFSLRGEHASRS